MNSVASLLLNPFLGIPTVFFAIGVGFYIYYVICKLKTRISRLEKQTRSELLNMVQRYSQLVRWFEEQKRQVETEMSTLQEEINELRSSNLEHIQNDRYFREILETTMNSMLEMRQNIVLMKKQAYTRIA